VRHKDGNRQNNDPANLVVVPSGAAYGVRPKARAGDWRDTGDNAAGVVRQIQAIGKRLAKSDPEELELLLVVQGALDEALRTAVLGQSAQGYSESEIGRGLGRTQQWVSKARKKWREDETNGTRASG
jgi:DNA-directed RNA polymerase specialized sigma24 family protein